MNGKKPKQIWRDACWYGVVLTAIEFGLVAAIGCSSPQARIASQVRTSQAAVTKAQERVRSVKDDIVHREALPLVKLTLGLLEQARAELKNPPASFGLAVGAATRAYDRLLRAAGPLDPVDDQKVQRALDEAKFREPALPGGDGGGVEAPRPPSIFTEWDLRRDESDKALAKAEAAEKQAKEVAKRVMSKAADQLDADAAYHQRMTRWFGLGAIWEGLGTLLTWLAGTLLVGALGLGVLSIFFRPVALLAGRLVAWLNPFRRKAA